MLLLGLLLLFAHATKARFQNPAVEVWFHQPSIRSLTSDHDSLFRLPDFLQGGKVPNQANDVLLAHQGAPRAGGWPRLLILPASATQRVPRSCVLCKGRVPHSIALFAIEWAPSIPPRTSRVRTALLQFCTYKKPEDSAGDFSPDISARKLLDLATQRPNIEGGAQSAQYDSFFEKREIAGTGSPRTRVRRKEGEARGFGA